MLNLFKKELSHFKLLPERSRKLVIAYLFLGLSYPMITTFINAYIFLNQGSLIHLIIYNVGHFIMNPVIFYLNGYLLKKIKITHLFFLGSILMGTSAIMVVFFSKFTLFDYFIYGIIYGTGSSFSWANRNYFTLKETHSKNRNYFLGLTYSNDTLASVFISFITGWLLVFGLSYQVIMIIGFLFSIIAGILILRTNYESPAISSVAVIEPTSRWFRMRWLHLSIGTSEVLCFFFPGLLILSKLGNVGVLGTLSSATAILSAILIYFYGRKASPTHQKPMFIISILVGLFTSVLYALLNNNLSVLIYVLSLGLIINFMWLTAGPYIMNIIDEEINHKEERRYSYIYDGELFLNIGRIIGLTVCLFMFFTVGTDLTLRFTPAIMYLLQFVILNLIFRNLL